MSIKELYRDDLLNRYASHTFTETAIEDMTLVEFKDAGDAVIVASNKLDVGDAYKAIRDDLIGGPEVLPQVTTIQRDALTGTHDGCMVWNTTTSNLDVCSGGSWIGKGA